jgi:cell division septum initiation protein DivIVA
MKAIETLREIRNNHSAKVLLFVQPQNPTTESLEVAANITEEEEETLDVAEYEKDRLLVDMQTAHAIVLVYEALKPETQVKADRLMTSKSGFLKVAKVAWGAVKAA